MTSFLPLHSSFILWCGRSPLLPHSVIIFTFPSHFHTLPIAIQLIYLIGSSWISLSYWSLLLPGTLSVICADSARVKAISPWSEYQIRLREKAEEELAANEELENSFAFKSPIPATEGSLKPFPDSMMKSLQRPIDESDLPSYSTGSVNNKLMQSLWVPLAQLSTDSCSIDIIPEYWIPVPLQIAFMSFLLIFSLVTVIFPVNTPKYYYTGRSPVPPASLWSVPNYERGER